MNCQEFENIIYREKALTPEAQRHQQECSSCRAALQIKQQTDAYLGRLMSTPPPEDFDSRVLTAFREQKQAPVVPLFRSKTRRALAASVAVAASITLGILLGSYSAGFYSESKSYAENQTVNDIGLQFADNSFDLINFDNR